MGGSLEIFQSRLKNSRSWFFFNLWALRGSSQNYYRQSCRYWEFIFVRGLLGTGPPDPTLESASPSPPPQRSIWHQFNIDSTLIQHRIRVKSGNRCRIDAKSTPEEGRARRIRGWGLGRLCLINPSQIYFPNISVTVTVLKFGWIHLITITVTVLAASVDPLISVDPNYHLESHLNYFCRITITVTVLKHFRIRKVIISNMTVFRSEKTDPVQLKGVSKQGPFCL